MNITRKRLAAVVGAFAFTWCGIAAEGAGETIFSIDAGNPGRTLPNVNKVLTLWELQESSFANVKRRNDADVLEFAEYVEVMGATGGNDRRDCFKDPASRAVLDDYDFSRLVAGCRDIVRLGLKPYLKLGNVPRKFSSDINSGDFGMNIRPPLDYDAYGRYMSACAKALLDAFGRDELLTWRFAVLTEFENGGWFKDASGNAEKTFQAYCRLYEVTVDAFTRTISPDLTFGAHAMAVTEGLWDERKFIKYAAERHIPLKFVTASFYDFNPGRFTSGFNLPNTIGHLRNAAESVGLTNLVYGIDEGRILSGLARGAKSGDLAMRIVGDTYQAAYDARIVRQLFDSNADYFAAWGYFSGPHTWFDGLPSVSFHVARESAKFKGMRRLPLAAEGKADGGVEADAVAALSVDGGTIRIMAYSFVNNLHATGKTPLRMKVKLPAAWKGQDVRVVRKTIDDDANWFDEWRRIRRERGIGDDRFNWSPDDPAPMHAGCGLKSEKDRQMFVKEIEPMLRDHAKLRPVEERMKASADGTVELAASLPVNSVVFLELANVIEEFQHSMSSYAAGVAEQGVSRGKGLARVVVTEAGADPTGKTDSTAAIQKCIDRVSATGGGTVVVPPGEYRILYLSLRPHVRLELAGGAERATDGWTPEVAARAMDPARSAIIRSAANRKGHWSIFLYNLEPRTAATNGVSDVAVSGGVFDCQGRCLPAAFACGRNIRFENAVVKDISNGHALQIDGCENVVVTNCLFAGYVFKGAYTCLTRETIQVEQTSPGALGNPETSPISCAKEISIPNRNVSVTGCWFGPSERLGPHLIPLGHHGRARSCNGLVFSGNVVVNPLYCGVRLANVSDVRVENNTFISTNATKRLADDSAVVCLWGGAALKPGEKGVVLRGNKIVLSEKSPLRRLWTTKARQKEVTVHDFTNASMRYTPVPGGYKANNGDGEFNRPLYGWHGDDRELAPRKSLPWTSDRPKVALKVFSGYKIDKKVLGVLQFGDGTEDVEYRYVWGRAEYDLKGKGTVKMVRSAESDGLLVETTGDLPPAFDGEWELAAKGVRGGATYYDFERKGMYADAQKRVPSDVAAAFDAATNHFERIARTIEIKTPDPLLDSLLPCQLLVADAMFEGRHITHGATNWRQAFAGWRVGYICYATGWEERFKENAREHFRSQRKDGRIPNEPQRDSSYNMCEEFAVSVMRYWKWTRDDAFMREIAYDGVKRHLAWMDRNMKVPGFDLYENWLNTWNTDNKWCNGGAGTIASAYYAFVCRTMAEVAQRLGKAEDAAFFGKRAKAVEEAIAKSLWHEGDGVWGEYRERFGLKRLMRAPDLSTVYIAIDSLPFDLARNRRAVAWVEDNVPTHFAKDGATLLYSSNRLPRFWTSCGRYPNETLFWALACYQTGEPELGWRHLHDVAAVSARGAGCGPGVGTCDLNYDFACYSNVDFADNAAGFIRTVAEGVFGIVDGREIRLSFPASWNEAEIKSPYVSYRWTRTGGVKMTGGSRAGTVTVVAAPKPKFAGAAIPPRHARWGHPKGEGSDLSIPPGTKAEYVDLSKAFNQNLRLLHTGRYSPRHKHSTLQANGRSWWERHEVVDNRHWPKDYYVPKKLDWPADGHLVTKYGPAFRLGPADGTNAVFVSFYKQFPDAVEIPLSGRARKIALLTAVVTNPNVAWMEAAVVKVRYADGTEAALPLVPPDNCDDWLSYMHGQWSYLDMSKDCKPYAVNGRPVMFGKNATHGNAHAIVLDPAKELKALRIECRGTETFVGLVAATLYR